LDFILIISVWMAFQSKLVGIYTIINYFDEAINMLVQLIVRLWDLKVSEKSIQIVNHIFSASFNLIRKYLRIKVPIKIINQKLISESFKYSMILSYFWFETKKNNIKNRKKANWVIYQHEHWVPKFKNLFIIITIGIKTFHKIFFYRNHISI